MRLKVSKQIIAFSSNYLGLLCLVLVLVSYASSKEVKQTQHVDASNFKNPIVWDSNSLYKSWNQPEPPKVSDTRQKRSATSTSAIQSQQLVDACQSKMQILTPYYATNSQGKLRTVVNSELMQQAIQVETCIRSPTSQSAAKCNSQLDCGCEQKYKWHRLLVLDQSDTGVSKGLFMDWFLFPSNCVCRCKASQNSSKQFLRTIKRIGTE